jgi:hypothetical protein
MALKIGIIDTGLNCEVHESIESIYLYQDDDGTVKVDRDVVGDTFGHGTICYTIIKEACPNLNFLIVKIFSDQYFVHEQVLTAAIERCLEEEVDLINISLGIRTSRISSHLNKVLYRAHNLNIPIISPAHQDHLRCFPASHPAVYGVGLTYKPGKNKVIYCFNSDVDILLNAFYFTNPIVQATSFASAKVAGMIANTMQNIDKTERLKSETLLRFLKDENII